MLKQQLQQKVTAKALSAADPANPASELPAIELEERIKHELEDNPALEEGKILQTTLNGLTTRVLTIYLQTKQRQTSRSEII